MSIHKLVFRENLTGERPDYLGSREIEQSFRYCFKGGGGSSAPSTSTSTQTSEPWAAQKGPLEYGYKEARRLYDSSEPSYFPGSTVQPLDPYQTIAREAGAYRAMSGNPLLPAAQQQVQNTLSGQYLNPDLGGVAQSIDAQIRPRVGAQFAMSGRGLSPAHQGTYAEAMANSLAPFAFNANQAERGRMMAASQMAPGLASADYGDINALATIGGQNRAFGQETLQDQINRYNFDQTIGTEKLNTYLAQVGAGPGGGTTTGTTTSTQPVYGGK